MHNFKSWSLLFILSLTLSLFIQTAPLEAAISISTDKEAIENTSRSKLGQLRQALRDGQEIKVQKSSNAYVIEIGKKGDDPLELVLLLETLFEANPKRSQGVADQAIGYSISNANLQQNVPSDRLELFRKKAYAAMLDTRAAAFNNKSFYTFVKTNDFASQAMEHKHKVELIDGEIYIVAGENRWSWDHLQDYLNPHNSYNLEGQLNYVKSGFFQDGVLIPQDIPPIRYQTTTPDDQKKADDDKKAQQEAEKERKRQQEAERAEQERKRQQEAERAEKERKRQEEAKRAEQERKRQEEAERAQQEHNSGKNNQEDGSKRPTSDLCESAVHLQQSLAKLYQPGKGTSIHEMAKNPKLNESYRDYLQNVFATAVIFLKSQPQSTQESKSIEQLDGQISHSWWSGQYSWAGGLSPMQAQQVIELLRSQRNESGKLGLQCREDVLGEVVLELGYAYDELLLLNSGQDELTIEKICRKVSALHEKLQELKKSASASETMQQYFAKGKIIDSAAARTEYINYVKDLYGLLINGLQELASPDGAIQSISAWQIPLIESHFYVDLTPETQKIVTETWDRLFGTSSTYATECSKTQLNAIEDQFFKAQQLYKNVPSAPQGIGATEWISEKWNEIYKAIGGLGATFREGEDLTDPCVRVNYAIKQVQALRDSATQGIKDSYKSSIKSALIPALKQHVIQMMKTIAIAGNEEAQEKVDTWIDFQSVDPKKFKTVFRKLSLVVHPDKLEATKTKEGGRCALDSTDELYSALGGVQEVLKKIQDNPKYYDKWMKAQ